jgi:hypothetical protein
MFYADRMAIHQNEGKASNKSLAPSAPHSPRMGLDLHCWDGVNTLRLSEGTRLASIANSFLAKSRFFAPVICCIVTRRVSSGTGRAEFHTERDNPFVKDFTEFHSETVR